MLLLQRTFRPTRGAARWIDPRPLAHVRDGAADGGEMPDVDRAEAIREQSGVDRVCVLGLDEDACRGRRGTLLRFSRAYADGDGARLFVRLVPNYDDRPATAEMDRWELRFTMARVGRGWRVVEQRTLRVP